MTDKQKLDAIKAEIHRLVDVRGYDREMANDLLAFMNSLPNEPVSEGFEDAAKRYATEGDEISGLYIIDEEVDAFKAGAKWQKEQGESTTEDLEKEIDNYVKRNGYDGLDSIEEIKYIAQYFTKWQKTKDDSCTSDLGDYINELSKQFTEVSFAKLSRIAVRVAKWQKEHLWKPVDGEAKNNIWNN